MNFGVVKSFDANTGVGLIVPESDGDVGHDVVVTQAAIDAAGLGQLAVNQRIGYEIETKGRHRSAVKLWAPWTYR
ncbi:MAG: cold shock domain-containing protein [Alphaproteobacteria bacterium]|nr:cold shock domain-containing protein [Alphaproteobacteria bacterium]MCZ6763965.1 cold shock domain-containing protein [Alphaproteobacteria bacterium]